MEPVNVCNIFKRSNNCLIINILLLTNLLLINCFRAAELLLDNQKRNRQKENREEEAYVLQYPLQYMQFKGNYLSFLEIHLLAFLPSVRLQVD